MRTKVLFDGHDLTELYAVSDLRRSLLPRELGSEDVPGMDGALFTGARLGVRTTTLTLTARAKDMGRRQQLARQLAEILNVSEPRPLQVSIDDGLWLMAVPSSGTDATRWLNATSFEVEFVSHDPLMRGDERTVTVPSGGSVTFTVGGSAPTMPLVAAPAARDGSGGAWILTLDGGMYLAASVPSAAALEADCEGRTLTVNGETALLRPDADWLVLEPGMHTLAMTGTGAASVTFTERWV